MNQNQNDEIEIDLLEVIKIFWDRAILIILAAVIFATAAFGYTLATTEQYYKATARVYINNTNLSFSTTSISLADLSSRETLVPTYSNLVKSEYHMLDVVLQKSGLSEKYSYEQLVGMIDCQTISDTAYLDVSVSSLNQDEAIILTNLIVDTLPIKVRETIEGSSITLIDPATKTVPVSRGFTKACLIGFVVGGIFAAGLVFLFDYILNDTVDTEDWLKQSFGGQIPLLSVIPDLDSENSHKKYGYYRGYYRNYYRKNNYYNRYYKGYYGSYYNSDADKENENQENIGDVENKDVKEVTKEITSKAKAKTPTKKKKEEKVTNEKQ